MSFADCHSFMQSSTSGFSTEVFFLPADPGQRYCVYRGPRKGAPCCGGVLYIPPFAEEMNKSRRMAAVQARALAEIGYGVLQIDLFGCGDSSGDFGEADWSSWKQDLARAWDWLVHRTGKPVSLWGLRVGALLALDLGSDGRACERFVFWQPVASGEAFLTQFLRLRVANQMLSEGRAKTGIQDLRAALAAGRPVEVAGYELSPALAKSLEGLSLPQLVRPGAVLEWLEIVPEAGRPLSPAAQRGVEACQHAGADVRVSLVPGQAFWTAIEIAECSALVEATTRVFAESRR